MATVWSVFAFFTAMASAMSFATTMYPAGAGSGRGALRAISSVVMIGSGVLTLIALRFALEMP